MTEGSTDRRSGADITPGQAGQQPHIPEPGLQEIVKLAAEYEERVARFLAGHAGGRPERQTSSGIRLKSVYSPLDVAHLGYAQDLSFPGMYPFTRGVTPTGYLTREWTRRQVMGYGTAEEANQRLRFLLEQGQTGISLTGMGYAPMESSDPKAEGLVGRGGVWIDTLEDMHTLFQGVDMERLSINQTGNSIPALAMIVAEAESRGLPLSELRGTVQNYVLPGGEGPALRGNSAVDIIEFCARNLPRWNHTSISIRNLRDTGLSAVQEVAFGLYQGMFTIEAALARGLATDQFASRMSYFLSAENELLEEVAKFRAYRRLWARLLRERYGAQHEESWALRFHVQTSALNLTAQQPLNNIVRATIHALAAVMGGAQSLSVNSYDEVLGLPAASAAVLSLRTQQIILHESGLADVLDPLGGSYCVEALTDQLEKAAWPTIDSLREMGGEQAFRYISEQTREEAYRRQRAIDSGERVIVGVNRFTMDMEEELPLQPREVFETDPGWREKQVERLNSVKRDRDEAQAQAALRRLEEAYRARDNILPPTVEAVKTYLSIGEIINALSAVDGWEALRKRRGFILGLYG